MTLYKRLRYLPACMLMFLALISCDDDFSTIGGELVGGQYDALPRYEAGVVAYNRKINAVQTNALSSYLLGVYNDPIYGRQVANVLTQVSLSANNPNFGNEPRLDSVVMSLPYFSTQLQADEDGNRAYRLDSVYGNSPFELSIARSNFFLNDLDPEANFENRQRYYSNMGPVFENSSAEPFYVNESFQPSAEAVSFRQRAENGEMDTVTVSPRMRLHLPLEFFQQNILDKEGSRELFNSNNFRNFLRGLYLKADPINDDGSMMLLDFNHPDAGIILYFTNTVEGEDDEEDTEEERSFRIAFGPNIVNTFSQELPGPIANEIERSDETTGAENLYLKGGEGSMAIIDLFEDEVELEELRSRDWIINEANLTFYVDQDIVPGGSEEPLNIFLYNLETNQPLITDFYSGQAQDGTRIRNPSHAPVLERNEEGDGIRYKIRITEYIRQLLNGNATPAKLGLVVNQNLDNVGSAALRDPLEEVTRVPSGSVMAPKGTVLHGNLSSNEEKRLKFNIYYTETSN